MESDRSEGKDEQDAAMAMNGDGDAAFLIGDTCKIIPCERLLLAIAGLRLWSPSTSVRCRLTRYGG